MGLELALRLFLVHGRTQPVLARYSATEALCACTVGPTHERGIRPKLSQGQYLLWLNIHSLT